MDDGVTLIKIIKDQDERIGKRACYKPLGEYWGYIEFIEVYSDWSEIWNVIEIGGSMTVFAEKSAFEIIEGEKKKFPSH